jgi:serine/threonine protein kinase
MLTVLGKGAFGTVFLGKLTNTNKFYAIKMLKKNEIIKSNSIDQVKLEISINNSCNHPNLLGIDFVKQQ